MAIILNEFLPVPNIAPSSYILLSRNEDERHGV